MRSLVAVQRHLQRVVLSGGGARASEIVSTPLADASHRLEIYANAYRLRLLEVLGNDFPGLRAIASATQFERLCRTYVEARPSPYYNLRWYGGGLAGFLRTVAPWSQEPALAEMATFEWALTLVFDGPDDAFVVEAEAAAIPAADWPDLQIELMCGLRRQRLNWNVVESRRAVDRGEHVPAASQLPSTQEWLLFRKDRNVRYRLLDADEAAALDAVHAGAGFTDLCALLCRWHAESSVALRAAELLKRWINDQCVRNVRAGYSGIGGPASPRDARPS